MKLSIIIVAWNVREEIVNCLRSIEANRPRENFEVIAVDNASSDGTVETIRRNFPIAVLIPNNENRGFAAANNQGLMKSHGDYILLLNPDTIVHPHSLDLLVEFMDDNADVGICGPKLLNSDGTTQPSVRRFPDFRSALYLYTVLKAWRLFRRQYRRYMMYDFTYNEQADVDQVAGAALMTRRSIMNELGGMDERFFMYYEEVDYCYRVKKAGWRIVFTPSVTITHIGARSASQIPIENQQMFIASVLKFFRKNRGAVATEFFCILFKPTVILRYVSKLVFGIPKYVLALILSDQRRQEKAMAKIKKSVVWLRRYTWSLLFEM